MKNDRAPKGATISRQEIISKLYKLLMKYTDEHNSLSRKEIVNMLMDPELEYNIFRLDEMNNVKPIETKKIMHILLDMQENDGRILNEERETPRKFTAKEDHIGENVIEYDDWRFEHDFKDSELLHLINLQLYSKFHCYNKASIKFIEKLKELNSIHFDKRNKLFIPVTADGSGYESALPEVSIFKNIDVINKAIVAGKQIRFQFFSYGLDEKSCKIIRVNQPEKKTMTPYALVMKNLMYYMIGSFDPYEKEGKFHKADKAYHYRVDLMSDVEIMEDLPARPIEEIPALRTSMDMTDYLNEHIYMCGGDSVPVIFRFDKDIMQYVLDWFGGRVRFREITEKTITARVVVNEQAMVYWALQFAQVAEILEPEPLREKVKKALEKAMRKYSEVV